MLLTRLAVQAGCSISEMSKRIPSSEWPYFLAFYELEPWGYEADNYHAGLVASTVANMSGKNLKKMTQISDFLTPKPLTAKQEAAFEEAKRRYDK